FEAQAMSRGWAATILTSSTATLFVLFAAATGTELVSTRFGVCNRIVFRLRAQRYNRRNRAWRLAKTESKSGRTSLSASTKSCPDHRPPFAPESGSICPVSYAYRMQSVGSLPIPLGWAEGRSSKNERAASWHEHFARTQCWSSSIQV